MVKNLILSLTLGSLMMTGATAGPQAADSREAARVPTVAAARAHPVRAVLRYDASTTSACRSFSDTSSEMCLLLALHVIGMSQKPLPAGAL
jgi:hypothetical protein